MEILSSLLHYHSRLGGVDLVDGVGETVKV